MLKHVFWENAVGYLRNGECQSFQTFAIVISNRWKLISRNFWSTGNESKRLSMQKCVLRNCCGVSQKWWMLELPNLLSLLTSRNFWSSRNEIKPLSKLKHVFRKCCVLSSEMVNAIASKSLPLCSAPLKTLLVGISGALGMKESHFLSKKYDLRKCCRVSQKWWMLKLPNLCQCLLVGISGALGMKERHFLS